MWGFVKCLPRLVAGGLVLALMTVTSLQGQTRSIRFDRISVEQGLSAGTVGCLLQDSTGFIWIGTQDGLNRYDGTRFVVLKHDPDDPATLTHNWAQALVEDPSGDLWVGTLGGGLNRWHRATDSLTHYRHDPEDPISLSGDRVWALLRDRAGTLWVGTDQSGLNRFEEDGMFERFRHDPEDPASLSGDRLRALYEDRTGRFWIGTLGAGLNLFDREAGAFTRLRHDPADPTSLSDDSVRSILEDESGTLWVGTLGGLNRLDPDTLTFKRLILDPADPANLTKNRIRALYEDRDGRLWVGTDSGLYLRQVDGAGESFVNYGHRQEDSTSLSFDRVMSIYQDRGGVLWVGTEGSGLNKWHPRTWSFTNDMVRPSDLSSRSILSMTEDDTGHLWLGTNGHGLNRVDRATGAVTHFRYSPDRPRSLSDDRVTALRQDRHGVLWVGTLGGGLNRFEVKTETFDRLVHDPDDSVSLGANGVMAIHEDRQGALWIGTFGGGLNRFDPDTETFVRHRHDTENPSSLADDRVTAFAEDPDGPLWLGTFSGGLHRFEQATGGHSSFLRIQNDPQRPSSLSSNTILSLHLTASGTLWVGTHNGLNRLESLDDGDAAFRSYFERDGLPSALINAVHADATGRLWLSTNKGLSRFDPQTETFRNFDVSHGLASNEFNMGAHYQSPAGELFFGGIDGFNAFYPDRIELNTTIPPVVLTSFSKLNQPVQLDHPIFDVHKVFIDYRDSLFSFEFAALDFTAPDRNRYRYKLKGFNDEWIDLDTRHQVTFTNLDPARYVLRVQGSNNDGIWNEEGTSIQIEVLPPPWRSWWAYSLYTLILASGVFMAVRIRQARSAIRREREKAKLREARLRADAAELESRALKAENERKEQELIKAKELERAYEALEKKNQEILRAEAQLVQAEKMAALGQLVAGVAHEINNPVNFISSGLPSLKRDIKKLANLNSPDDRSPDHDKLRGRLDSLIAAIDEGASRTAEIVKNLRTFSRLDEAEVKTVDLNQALDTTLSLLHHQTRDRIPVVRDYDDIPAVECYVSQLNQVFMNLLVNAIQAIDGEGTITITTARAGDDHVRISIRDTGNGMTQGVQRKIFDPFFTTKPVGQGTGLGLSISHGIIEKHGGTITVESEPGRGSELTLVLPLRLPPAESTEESRPDSG